MTSTVKVSGGEKLRSLLMLLQNSKKAKVDVGFFKGSTYADGTQVAQVAVYNEYGGARKVEGKKEFNFLPPRPFLHPTYDEKLNEWKKLLSNKIKSQKNNIDIKSALTYIGLIAQHDVQDKIDWWAESGSPRNAKRTIENKGFDSPLIETGHLRESVKFKVSS